MSPKKRAAKELAAPKGQPKHEGVKFDGENAAHFVVIEEDLKTIFKNKVFEKVSDMEPLDIGKGGTRAKYDKKAYAMAMKDPGYYECGENFFKHNVLYSARARVPLVESRIKDLMNDDFQEPCVFPQELIISSGGVNWDPQSHIGAWQSVSADEFRFAYVRSIARDIRAGKDVKAWLKHALTAKVTFKAYASEMDRYYAATNVKEAFASTYGMTMITTYQRIVEINLYKDHSCSSSSTSSSSSGSSSNRKTNNTNSNRSRSSGSRGNSIGSHGICLWVAAPKQNCCRSRHDEQVRHCSLNWRWSEKVRKQAA